MAWNWTQETTLTAGLRYSYDEKKGGDNTFVQYVGDPNDPTVYRTKEDDWDKWTWRLGVDHFLTPDQFLYGFIATGYRSGGFNFQKPTASPLVDVVKPEEILSYEIGYKGAMLERRLNISSSVYYYDYQDLQVIKSDVVEGISLNTFVNADKARAMGVELEVQALDESERAAFAADFGLKDPSRDRVLRAIFDATEQITFFTSDEKEVRAWLLRRGMTALEA